MNDEGLHLRAKQILADALQRTPQARSAYVAEVCGSEATLLAEVESLLKFATTDNGAFDDDALRRGRDRLEALLGSPAPEDRHSGPLSHETVTCDESRRGSSDAIRDKPGRSPNESRTTSYSTETPVRVGKYQINRLVGQGGMGRVFEAVQDNPRRRVALKLIRTTQGGPAILRRFEYEAQVLGRLEYPGIARIYEAGSEEVVLSDTPRVVAGPPQPFFAMEFVDGQPLDVYAHLAALSIPDRLRLVVQICLAVNHAHTKGVIHRDLKPSNILVTADGTPKVLDFGIARMAEDHDASLTRTHPGHLIGTPAYMSPEQAAGSADIDTRTDVYALGVLLYVLLTGVTPFDPRDLRYSAVSELQRMIREVEPPKPSTRLSSLLTAGTEGSDAGSTPGSLGSLDPRSLVRQLRGELDWIVMKALEKDRSRRYQSASELAADIERFLAGEAIVAAPPSTAYRVRKFIGRHKLGVWAGGAIAATLILGALGTTGGMIWAWEEQARSAEQAAIAGRAADRAVAAEKAERRRADELKQVSDFQAEMLDQVDPTEAGVLLTQDVIGKLEAALIKAGLPEAERPEQIRAFAAQWNNLNATDTARELIDRTILKPAIDAIDKQFKDQPVLDAQLRQVLADRYWKLGLYEAAAPLQVSALETRRHELGDEHPDTLISINNMGLLLQAQGKMDQAEPYYREALEKSRRVLGDEDPNTLKSINNIGDLLRAQGKLDQAEPCYREALEKSRRVLGDEHPDTLILINNMGMLLKAQGKLDQAEPYFREALEKRRRVLGDEHPNTLTSINNMGALLDTQGKLDQAEPYYHEALEKSRRVLGDEHPNTLNSINNMGFLLQAQGKLDQAEPYYREALEKCRRVLGDEHPGTLISINNMGNLLRTQGKLDQAEPYFREVLEKGRRLLGEEHSQTLSYITNMGILLVSQGKYAEAEALLLPAFATAEAKLPPGHKVRMVMPRTIAKLYTSWDEAEPGNFYDAKAAEWQAKVRVLNPDGGP